ALDKLAYGVSNITATGHNALKLNLLQEQVDTRCQRVNLVKMNAITLIVWNRDQRTASQCAIGRTRAREEILQLQVWLAFIQKTIDALRNPIYLVIGTVPDFPNAALQ